MNVFSQIQAQFATILKSAAPFADCRLVVVDQGDVDARLEEALAAASTSVLIAPPSARFTANGGQGPVSTDGGVRTALQVIETPAVGRQQGSPGALDLAAWAGWLGHSCNHPDRRDAIPQQVESIEARPDPEVLIIQLVFVSTVVLSQPT